MLRWVALILLISCTAIALGFAGRPQEPPYSWVLPGGFPVPPTAADNPLTRASVALGRHLFYDPRLSRNATVSCASCHQQAYAFSDPVARSIGATGERTARNAMSLTNVAFSASLDWANPNVTRIEHQMLTPLFGEEPVEMGLAGHEERVLAILNDDPVYRQLIIRAYGDSHGGLSWQKAIYAIANFVRTLVSANSPYDRYLNGDSSALSASALRGLELFVSEDLECFHCHGGFNFTDSSTHDPLNNPAQAFHNTGLYNLSAAGAYPQGNEGVYTVTENPIDMGRFKAPTLRNIAYTAPYMHDGSIADLDGVIAHYARGGRLLAGELAGDGSANPLKSEFVTGFELDETAGQDLINFLHSLSDDSFVANPALADPWLATH